MAVGVAIGVTLSNLLVWLRFALILSRYKSPA